MSLYNFPGQPGSSSWRDWYFNYEPDAGYADWMDSLGFGMGQGRASNPLSAFIRSLYGQYQTDYKRASGYDANLQWTDYLRKQDPTREWLGMSPEQRGEHPGRYSPRLRWVV